MYYKLKAPQYMRFQASRVSVEIETLPAHEALFREILDTPDLPQQLAEAKANNRLPAAYYEHPVVQSADLIGFHIHVFDVEA